MKYLLDTNTCIAFLSRHSKKVEERLRAVPPLEVRERHEESLIDFVAGALAQSRIESRRHQPLGRAWSVEVQLQTAAR